MKKKAPYDKSVYRSFVLVMQFGLNMLVPICMLTALGVYLDRRLGTSFLTIVLFLVGAVAGAQNCYRMAKQILDSSGQESRKTQDGQKEREEQDGGNADGGGTEKAE